MIRTINVTNFLFENSVIVMDNAAFHKGKDNAKHDNRIWTYSALSTYLLS
jgi:hypothetical protein